ncbi:MAG: hypothetical protein AAF727_14435 [Pseudomonadota bacterium]
MFGQYTGVQKKSDAAVIFLRNRFRQLHQPIFVKRHFDCTGCKQSRLFCKGFGQATHQRLGVSLAARGPAGMQQRARLKQVCAWFDTTGHGHEPQEIQIGKGFI